MVANKVTHIINCAGRQVPNHWEGRGVVYLTFQWLDVESQTIFDPKDNTTKAIYDFIESAIKKYESVLVHSVRGQSRASSVLAAYFMRKYRWSMLKTLEFLNSRRPDLEIRGTFIQQLQQFEQRLSNRGLGPLSFNFNELSFKGRGFQRDVQDEEMIIRNTFLNAQMGQIVQYNMANMTKRDRTLRWIDLAEPGKQGSGENPKPKLDDNSSQRAAKSMPPLAKLVPLEKTVSFHQRVIVHHGKR